MTKLLFPTQLQILTAAAQHPARLPEASSNLPAAARNAVLRSMLRAGLLEEVSGAEGTVLRITEAGLAAVGTRGDPRSHDDRRIYPRVPASRTPFGTSSISAHWRRIGSGDSRGPWALARSRRAVQRYGAGWGGRQRVAAAKLGVLWKAAVPGVAVPGGYAGGGKGGGTLSEEEEMAVHLAFTAYGEAMDQLERRCSTRHANALRMVIPHGGGLGRTVTPGEGLDGERGTGLPRRLVAAPIMDTSETSDGTHLGY